MSKSATGRVAPWHSVRLQVLVTALVLELAGLVFAGLDLASALQERRDAQALAAASTTLATLSRATIDLSLERSLSQVSIELPRPVDPAVRRMIDAQRRKADAGLQQAMDQAAQLTTTTQLEAFARGLGALRTKLAVLRGRFDGAMALPLEQRQAADIVDLPRDLKALVVEFQADGHLLRGPGYRLPTDVSILESIREKAWQIREFGGRERTYLAIAVATGAPIGSDRLQEMAVLARRAADAWTDVSMMMRHGSIAESMRGPYAALGAGYFGSYERLRQAMLAEAEKPRPAYPLTFDSYFAASRDALLGAEALASAASEAIDEIWVGPAAATLHQVVAGIIVTILILAMAVVCALLIIRAFRRLDALRAAMVRLAGGDLTTEVPYATARNEFGGMARALVVFRETAQERAALEAQAAAEQADKDRRQAAMEAHLRDFTESLAGVMRGLSAAAGRMSGASESMAQAAERTGALARGTTAGAEASARDLVTVASATEELTASVTEIARQVSSAAATAQGTARHADGTEQAMAGLSQAADRIGAVARLIGEIAGQTNLLALNATIEAARAGDAGKGFAVVASEVKQLAGRTATATGEIAEQIGAIQTATRAAVEAVRQMSVEVRQMEEIAGSIAAAIEEQGTGVREIAASIATVTQATENAVRAMSEATSAADNARLVSAEVREAAGQVGEQSDTLGREVEQFLKVVLTKDKDRRRYARTDGRNTAVTLILADGALLPGRLVDISAGGVKLRLDARPAGAGLAAGMPATIALPGDPAPLPFRIVRLEGDVVALVARMEAGVAERLEHCATALGAPQRAA